MNHEVSKNEEHIWAINPKWWSCFVSRFKLSDKVLLWLMMLAIVVIGGAAFVFFYLLVMTLKWWTLLVVGGYLAIYSLSEWITNRVGGKALTVVERIISAPIVVVYLLVGMILPFITIVGAYFFLMLFAFGVPAIILTFLSKIEWWVIKPETIVFIVLALGSMLCAHSYRTTQWMVHQTPLRDWGQSQV